ncbi:MAG: sugar phosphate isomerase/epimerase [Candidatus Hydrogenedentes bacterium]|nr:sugar phosphate isomerase/epimerase [Candidatus Hydrogenedentota bacterium]
MFVGFLTTPFADRPLDAVLDFAQAASIRALEIHAAPGTGHIDPLRMDRAEARRLRTEIESRDLVVSALAWYTGDLLLPKKTKETQGLICKLIDAAAALGVDTVCLLAGFDDGGRGKLAVIERDLPGAWKPILKHATKRKTRIAIENYHKTVLQGVDTIDALFEAIPHEALGLNYDPSHLVHQGCDHLETLRRHSERIFHVHAKDCFVDHTLRSRVGIYGSGWWRYVLPGSGKIQWGEFISQLRAIGYTGVLSIEHEDRFQELEEGFRRAAWHLEQYC